MLDRQLIRVCFTMSGPLFRQIVTRISEMPGKCWPIDPPWQQVFKNTADVLKDFIRGFLVTIRKQCMAGTS